MFRLRTLKICNFGPYYHTNLIEFKEDSGVIFVWGENGDGKTSLLNSLSYVLCDEILSRTRRRVSPVSYVNRRAIEEKEDMYVEVELISDNKTYIINRGLKRNGGSGENDFDYQRKFSMLEDGVALPVDKANETLSSILPRDISRFYLFDAELMAEYEKLLDPHNTDGDKIKKSIEDLLGLPILINGRDSLSLFQNEYSQRLTRIAKSNQKCKRYAQQLEETREIYQQFLTSKSSCEEKLDGLNDEKNEIEQKIKQNKRYIDTFKEIELAKEKLKSQKEEYRELLNDLKPKVSKTWMNLLYSVSEKKIQELDVELKELRKKSKEASSAKTIYDLLVAFESKCKCPICSTTIDPNIYVELVNLYKGYSEKENEDIDKITQLEETIRNLHKIKDSQSVGDISKITQNLRLKQFDINRNESKIEDLNLILKKLGDSESEGTQNFPEERDKKIKEISLVEENIRELKQKIESTQGQIKVLEKSISDNGAGEEFEKAKRCHQLVEDLYNLFKDSIDIFRNQLTLNIQNDATDFFRNITNRPDQYDKLEINENFGLQIRHKDGSLVPNRSGGEEQIVAFSLINALHKNAPIDGPIFMDSTFQRIDRGHQSKSAKSLLGFNTQIVLLLYKDEIKDISEVRNLFSGRLLHEYYLHKINGDSYKSEIID